MTSDSPAAIAIIEVAGPSAMEVVTKLWKPFVGSQDLLLNRIRFGNMESINDSEPGESIVVCRTADDRIELHCHGGVAPSNRIIAALKCLGLDEVSNHDRMRELDSSEIAREAMDDLVLAQTRRTTSILLDQYRGALDQAFSRIDEFMTEGQMEAARRELNILEKRYTFGSHLVRPWKVVLAGPPNVGKSSLLNSLLGYARAIVHDQAGTTRDRLCEQTNFEGWPIELIDGAGIRGVNSSIDAVEAMGIRKSFESIAMADVLLLLVDSTDGWTETHTSILQWMKSEWTAVCGGNRPHPPNQRCTSLVIVLTKCDLLDVLPIQDLYSQIAQFGQSSIVQTSSQTGQGVSLLMERVVDLLVPLPISPGDAVPFRRRHIQWIEDKLNVL